MEKKDLILQSLDTKVSDEERKVLGDSPDIANTNVSKLGSITTQFEKK
jgi:hypothetical protein